MTRHKEIIHIYKAVNQIENCRNPKYICIALNMYVK